MIRSAMLLPAALVWTLGTSGSPLTLAAAKPAVTAPRPAQTAVTAEGLLERALRAEGQLTFKGVMDANGESRLTVLHASENRQRQEWISPPALKGDLVIDNGALRWHYSPQDGHADVSPSQKLPLTVARRMALIRQNYQLSLHPGQTVAKTATRQLLLQPKAAHQLEHRLFVADKGLILRAERWRNGQLLDYTAYTSIDWKPTFTKDAFAPTLPTGTKVKPTIHVLANGPDLAAVAGKLDFRPVLPQRLPGGFQSAAVRVFTTSDKPAPIIHWQLTDGMSSVSLFARKATAWRMPAGGAPVSLASGVQGARMEESGSTMLVWQVGGVRYSLVGAIAPESLIETAQATIDARSGH